MRQHALASLSNLPPFSIIMNRLMASLAGADVGLGKLADLVEKDTVISGNLLHLVNSALYARRGTINSVRHALSLLGIEKVRNVVLGMSITRMWSHVYMPPSLSMARFNIHSSAVAILGDCLVQRVPTDYAEGAFVAGLLHDLGRLLIALSLPDEHERLVEMHRQTGRPIRECEKSVLGFSHPELSAEALTFWNLPEPIRTAVLYHHDPDADDTVSKKPIHLSRIVNVANEYANSLGISIFPDNESADESPKEGNPALFESLGLNGDKTRVLLDEFNTEREAMAQFFR
jgi:HD-like signal output (HDOD) protein